MFYHGRFPLLSLALLSLSTGCASVQSNVPIQEELEVSKPRIDYIDDRINEVMDEKFDERVDDSLENTLDSDLEVIVDEEFDDRPEPRRRRSVRPIRQISFLAAYRDFTDGDLWDRVDAETALGIDYAHEVSNGLGFELGTIGSLGTRSGEAGNVDVTGASAELYGGARYFFRNDSRWLPYVGGGLSGILAGVDNDQGGEVADDQDFTIGLYLRGGVQYQVNNTLFLAADLRTLLGTDLELETVSGDADYFQLGLSFGFRL